MTEPVDKEVCFAKHGELTRRADVSDRRLNAHAENIGDMKDVLIRLVTLQESSTELQKTSVQAQKDQNLAMASMDRRVNVLETQRVKLTDVHLTELEDKPELFWSTKGGQLMIMGGVGIAFILTFAAIGQSVNPDFLAGLFGK